MVYYVFLDPALISVASQHGEAGLSSFVSLLGALDENCCVAEFDDWRVTPALKAQLAAHVAEGTDWSKRIKVLLSRLEKQRRFIVVLTAPEQHPLISDAAAAAQHAESAELDALLTEEAVTPAGGSAHVIGLFDFAGSHFDQARRRHAVHGVNLAGNEHSSAEFYEKFLSKILQHAVSVEFLDRLFGDKYADHFKFTLRAIVREFALNRNDGATSQFIVHTDASDRVAHCRIEVDQFHADIRVAVEAYGKDGEKSRLPHQRYLLTDQFAIDIGRGLDLFDKDSNRNRDVSLSFKNAAEVRALLHRAAAARIA